MIPHLPIPTLQETKERYIKWCLPLVENKARLVNDANNFFDKDALELQKQLEAFCDAQNKAGKSYLIDFWRNGYWSINAPTTLSTNVSARLNLPISGNFRLDLARFIAAHAKLCSKYKKGELANFKDAKGADLSLDQAKILLGACRILQDGIDIYHFANDARQIALIFAKKISDLDYETPLVARFDVLDRNFEALNFDDIYANVCAFLDAHIKNAGGENVFLPAFAGENIAFFNDTLFNITITKDALSYEDVTFGLLFDPRKALSYIAQISDDVHFYQNIEHSYQDAGILVDFLREIKGHVESSFQNLKGAMGGDVRGSEIEFLDFNFRSDLADFRGDYLAKAREFKLSLCQFQAKAELNKDAYFQFIMQYAQKQAFGSVRSIYEAVDMRHFKCGRTECIRSVSEESLKLISSSNINKANLEAAMLEHKARIKACKNAKGVMRHLSGLRMMKDNAFFKSEGYLALSSDFLSTTTLGDNGVLFDIGFVPSIEGGFGINYYYNNGHMCFLISYKKSQKQDFLKFKDALERGIREFEALLG
ncbi:MAG: choline/carnitine O-acyltransferase [Helicobacter sp.]|nr:choline/carnitine O-acyltransferase [Helicobacter sp.]